MTGPVNPLAPEPPGTGSNRRRHPGSEERQTRNRIRQKREEIRLRSHFLGHLRCRYFPDLT
jgi:hypothetical protein